MAKIEIKDLEKQQKQLKASFQMWEKTIDETIKSMEEARNEDGTKKFKKEDIDDKVQLLRNGEDDIIEKWVFLGGSIDELKAEAKSTKPVVKKKSSTGKTVLDKIAEAITGKGEKGPQENPGKNEEVKNETSAKKDEPISEELITKPKAVNRDVLPEMKQSQRVNVIPKSDDTNPMASYDIIPLPSNGECYANKMGRIAVSYLTAIDENIIVSPNLYRDNLVLDIILREKIRNQEIDPDDLLDGDRDAIILFLRTSAYGNKYAVTTTDPETGTQFDTTIDLSKIKYKDFTLTGDENGYFDFEIPSSKDKIKFRFLTHRDYKNLAYLDEMEVAELKKEEIKKCVDRLNKYIKDDEKLAKTDRASVLNAINVISNWGDKCAEDGIEYAHRATNELEMQIMSVNGNTDRKYIHEYVMSMPIKDSGAIRKYIAKNTPGVDYNFDVEKPESLGGGSMKVFLQFNQFIFLTDTE